MKTGSVCPEMSKDAKTMRKSTIWDREEPEGALQIRNLRRLPRLNPHPVRVIGERFIGNSFPFMGLVSKTWSRMLGRIASYAEKGTSGDPTARDAESISYKNYEAGANERVRKRSQSR